MFVGENFTLIQNSKSLISFGANGKGQLGREGDHVLPQNIEVFDEIEIDQISCGKCHSLVLTKNRKLYSFGDNKHRKLGFDENVLKFTTAPVLIEYFKDKQIEKIKAGCEHSFVYCSDGILYSFGDNSFYQLGQSENNRKVDIFNQTKWNTDDQILEIYTGPLADYSFIKSKNGCFGFGLNIYRQIFDNNQGCVSTPTFSKSLSDLNVKDIKLTETSTWVLTEDGKVYLYGERNLLETTDEKEVIFFKEKIIKLISAGEDMFFAHTNENELYFFGKNFYQQKGYHIYKNLACPLRINIFQGISILNIISGGYFSFIITENHDLFGYGCNSFGQLGLNYSSNLKEIVQNKVLDVKNIFGYRKKEYWHSWKLLTLESNNQEYEKWKLRCPHINFLFN